MTAARNVKLAVAALGLLSAVVIVAIYLSLRAPGENAKAAVPPASPVSAPPEETDAFSPDVELSPDAFASLRIDQLCPDVAALIGDAVGIADSEHHARQKQRDALASRQLAAADSPELLLVAALLSDDADATAHILDRLLSADVQDPALLSGAMTFCTSNEALCRRHDVEERLLRADPENTMVWATLAMRRYESGDVETALDALKRAASATQTRTYWTEHIEIIERSLASASGRSFSERASTAFAYSAFLSPSYRALFTMCRDRAAETGDWADPCLRIADKLESQGDTRLGRKVGAALQERIRTELGLIGPDDSEPGRSDRMFSYESSPEIVNLVLMTQPSYFVRFLELARTDGESAASGRMTEEALEYVRGNQQAFCETVRLEFLASPELR